MNLSIYSRSLSGLKCGPLSRHRGPSYLCHLSLSNLFFINNLINLFPPKQYLELQKPLYERRNAIITGVSTATSEEIAAGEAASLKDDDTYTPLSKDAPPSSTGIPEFWLTALRNHIALSDLITERDANALKHLVDVRLEYLKEGDVNATEGKAGFKIIFEFSPNDFFENNVLEKTYLYGEEVDYSGDFVYNRAIGTKIQWKDDKDLTKEFEIKKQRNKSTCLFFFSIFARRFFLTFLFQIPTVLAWFAKLAQ